MGKYKIQWADRDENLKMNFMWPNVIVCTIGRQSISEYS